MAKRIDDQTLAILSRVTVEGNKIFLTCGQLDRKQYTAVNEILEHIGGKWNRSAKAHLYPTDPTDALEQVLTLGEIVPPEKYGYFPTPPALAKHIVEIAAIQHQHRILEPSAGQGGIAIHLPGLNQLDCVELLPENVKVLKDKSFNVIREGDFLAMKPTPIYDRVVMNPPFEKQADIDHVMHAWKFLKAPGRLVAIMSASVAFRENKKTTDFRELVRQYGFYEHNPEGSFKESGTMVSTVTVVLCKPVAYVEIA
jgi:predicted RNA methylase